jgi:hypothetical protein
MGIADGLARFASAVVANLGAVTECWVVEDLGEHTATEFVLGPSISAFLDRHALRPLRCDVMRAPRDPPQARAEVCLSLGF